MAIHRIPRNIFRDIIEYSLCEEYGSVSDNLQLRLVNHQFDIEVSEALFDRDVMDFHNRVNQGLCCKKPTGIALQRVVRGFILRPATSSDILNTVRRTLRDGALIATVLLGFVDDAETPSSVPKSITTKPLSSTDDLTSKALDQTTASVTTIAEIEAEDETQLPDYALKPVCKAYVDLLGEERAFDSLDLSWERDPAHFEILNDKTGHFWAFLAAAIDGRPEIVTKAAKACSDRFRDAEDPLQLKTYFAAGLLTMAKEGHVEAAKTLLAHPDVRVNLRLQNIRFAGKNAFEAAIDASQDEMVELLLTQGWELTTVPMDYIRALKATVANMKPSPARVKLLKILLEGTCQQWRSDAITTGMYNELCKQGDLETSSKILSLVQNPPKSPTKAEYRWKWDFKDDATNEFITAPPPTDDENEIDNFDFEDFTQPEEKTALYYAVKNDHHRMIPFILDNEDHFPGPMEYTFAKRTKIRCLEHAIKNAKQDTLRTLLPYSSDIDKSKLFLYAVYHGSIDAMNTLIPDVDLSSHTNAQSPFWDRFDHPDLCNVISYLEEYLSPDSFLFSSHTNNPTSMRIGTYMLVCAMKTLQVPATKYLLERGCEIGTHMVIVSPSLVETQHARAFFPSHNSDEALDDCLAGCCNKNKTPSITKDRRKKTLSKDKFKPPSTLIMLTSSRFSYTEITHMIAQGAKIPQHKSSLCLTKHSWWQLKRWKASRLDEMKTRIITGISVPMTTWTADGYTTEQMEERFDEMQKVLVRWKMPYVYCRKGEEW